MLDDKALRICICKVHYNISNAEYIKCIKMFKLICRSYF